jgi:two-component system sensor histidine kinase ChiS
VLIIITILSTAIYITWSNYKAYLLQKQNNFQKQYTLLSNAFDEEVQYVENIVNTIGKKIIESNDLSAKNIAFLINQPRKNLRSDIFTWTLFDYVTRDGYVAIDSIRGLLKDPIKLTPETRGWLMPAKKNPGKVYFSWPSKGVISGEYILPVGVGLKNKKGKFVGYISLGININKLIRKLENATDGTVSFILLTADNKLVGSSEDSLTEQVLGKHPSRIVNYNNIEFSFKKPLANYPFTLILGQDEESSYKSFKQFILPQIIRNTVMGVIFISLLIFLGRQIVKPLVELSNSAAKIAHGKQKVDIKNYDIYEIELLAEQLREIKRVKKALGKSHDTLEKRVQERTFELEKALKAKTEFLNNISHEVRTPIQGVTAISQGLVEHWSSFDENRRYDLAKEIARNSDRLFSLVNSLLDLSQFEATKMTFNLQPNDLEVIVAEIIEECKPLWTGKGLEVGLIKAKGINTITNFDPIKIGQVVRNLLANAIKFTSEGKIIINLSESTAKYVDGRKAKGLLCSVKDEGIGVPEEELEEIFNPFTQSSRTKTGAGGTGLGLAICHEIIRAHNGKVWVENNKSEKGATFKFIIPYPSKPKKINQYPS